MGKVQDGRVNLEKSMFIAHTFHFLLSTGKASLFPFLTIYFRLLGLSATQVGWVFATQAFIRLWCAPLWTACAKACKKKKFVLVCSTFILLASSVCLSLAPPSDPDNSPLYCNGPLTQLNSEQTDQHQRPENDNSTSNTIVPGVLNVTLQPARIENVDTENRPAEPDSTEDETNREVDKVKGDRKKGTATTISVVPSSSTSSTTSSTTTTATTTTTKKSYHRHGSTGTSKQGTNKHKEEYDETAELADKISKLGIKAEDLEGMSSKQIDNLISSVLGKDESVDDRDSGYRRSSEEHNDEDSRYKYAYNYNDYDQRWRKTRQKKSTVWHYISERLGKEGREHNTFVFILALTIVGELLSAPVDKLADDCWFEYLDILDVGERYGGHRVWQLMGYILLPVFVGTIVEKTNCILMHNVPHFMIHFFIFAGFAALAFMVAFAYPMSQNKRTPKQSRFGKGVRILCCDIHSLTLTITIFMLGVMYACIQNFLLWKVQDVGGDEIVIGASIAVSATSSLLMYVISNALIKRITNVGAIVLAMITLAGRLVFYSFLWTPWIVLAGEAFHGFSYTLLWRAVEMYPDFRINPFIMDRSAYTLISVIYHGLGIGLGSAISGYMYDQFGFSLLFQGASVAITAWCALFLLLQRCVKRKMKVRYAKLLQEDRGVDDSSSDEDDWLEVAMKNGSK